MKIMKNVIFAGLFVTTYLVAVLMVMGILELPCKLDLILVIGLSSLVLYMALFIKKNESN